MGVVAASLCDAKPATGRLLHLRCRGRALISRAAKSQDGEEYDRYQNQADRKADTFSEAFREIDREDDKEDRKAD